MVPKSNCQSNCSVQECISRMNKIKMVEELTTLALFQMRAWLKFETDKNNLLYVRVDKTRKINTRPHEAMGLSDNDVIDKLRHPEFYQSSIESANDEGINSEDQAYLSFTRSFVLVNHPLFLVDNSYYIADFLILKI